MSQTAVVILNYNGEKLLHQFLPTVLQFSSEARIIVADNASSDGSVALLKKDFPTVELILLDQNYGFCGGYNRALKQVTSDYYVLLNSDIEVTPEWLTPMIRRLEVDPTIAAIQPKIMSFHDKRKFEYAGAAGGFIDSLGYPFCRGRIFDHVEEDHGQYDDEREIFWATGACLMIRSEAFHLFGGFDEDYFAHMEEIDLCWKLHRLNRKVFFTSKSKVFHVGAGTLGYGNPRKTYLNFRNGLFVFFKHLSTPALLVKFPVRLALDWVAALRFFLQGDVGNGKAILRAHVDFWGNLGRERKKRSDLRAQYPGYSRDTIKRGAIIFDYYVLGKKTFS